MLTKKPKTFLMAKAHLARFDLIIDVIEQRRPLAGPKDVS
jgi:hypothetical protein